MADIIVNNKTYQDINKLQMLTADGGIAEYSEGGNSQIVAIDIDIALNVNSNGFNPFLVTAKIDEEEVFYDDIVEKTANKIIIVNYSLDIGDRILKGRLGQFTFDNDNKVFSSLGIFPSENSLSLIEVYVNQEDCSSRLILLSSSPNNA